MCSRYGCKGLAQWTLHECRCVGVRCEGCTCVHSGLPRIKGNEMVDSNGGMEYVNDL